MKKSKKQLVEEALLRRAVGYETTETVEEYAECDGEIKLVKRKVSTKNVPPDVAAAKLVIEEAAPNVAEMTDEELSAEKERLLAALRQTTGKK
ncbi:MAG: hypothetical protein IJU84_08860 [Clostridia bacterium]|nr:hypothetical protein [Clostridia bacterium]MBQ9482260.1 hypothetical protein [Clostridia bacterium]